MYCDIQRVMRLLECEKTRQIFCCYGATGKGKGKRKEWEGKQREGKGRKGQERAWKGQGMDRVGHLKKE